MSSDSDRDDSLGDDLEALRRACKITGTALEAVAGNGSEEDDDLDLPRLIQQRFSIPSSAVDSLPATRSLKTILPCGSDDDDDFETLQAVQRRFEQYRSESLRETQHECVDIGKPCEESYEDKRTSEQTLSQEYSLNNTTYELASTSGTRLQGLIQDSADASIKVRTKDPQVPKSCLMIVESLKKNRSLQKFLRDKMLQFEAKIAENKELRSRIKCLVDFQVGCKRRAGKILSQKKDPRVRLISLPKSTIKKGSARNTALYTGPAENSHVENYKMVMSRFPVSFLKQPWTTSDKEKLIKGLKQQYQEMLLLDAMELASDPDHSGEINSLDFSSVGDCDVASQRFRSFLKLVNWERLASMYFTGRTGAECETRWFNCEDPLINNSKWTAEEEKKLLLVCQECGVFNWIDIASKLGTHRTPFKCLMRYQRSLNVHILKKEWTEDEDAQLLAATEMFGKDWQLIASTLAGRTGAQCSNRWRKHLHPGKTVGRWTIDEDRCLKVAVLLLGAKNWSKVVQFVPGRNQSQCRERWAKVLNPSLSLKPWTEEEDSRLKDAIDRFGYCWSDIANYVSHRTDGQCRRRWKVLFPHEVPLLWAARKMQKAALISNFVDREDERPLICPSDFHSAVTQNLLTHETLQNSNKRKKLSNDVSKESSQQNYLEGVTADTTASMSMTEDREAGKYENNNKTKKQKKRRMPQRRGDKVTQISGSGQQIEISVSSSIHEELENGIPRMTHQSQEIPGTDDASPDRMGSRVQLCEYTISLKNAKRGRSRILLKRVKSGQLSQNTNVAPSVDAVANTSEDAFEDRMIEVDNISASFISDSNPRVHNVEERVDRLTCKSTDDHTKLSDSRKVKKKHNSQTRRGKVTRPGKGLLTSDKEQPTKTTVTTVTSSFHQESENGLSRAVHQSQAIFQTVANEASLDKESSLVKSCEDIVSLKKPGRGRPRLLPKSDKSGQLSQNIDEAPFAIIVAHSPNDAEPDASKDRMGCVSDFNLFAHNVEERVDGLASESTEDHTLLSEFITIAKKEKRSRKKLLGKGVKHVQSTGNPSQSEHNEVTDTAPTSFVAVCVDFCADIARVRSFNGGTLSDTSPDVKVTDALPVCVTTTESIGSKSNVLPNNIALSNGDGVLTDCDREIAEVMVSLQSSLCVEPDHLMEGHPIPEEAEVLLELTDKVAQRYI